MTQPKKTPVTVHSLQKSGYEVDVVHMRYYEGIDSPIRNCGGRFHEHDIKPRGGITYVTVILPEVGAVAGRAVCSLDDNYNKRLGAHIALMRALGKKPKNDGNKILTPVLNSIRDNQEYENRQ